MLILSKGQMVWTALVKLDAFTFYLIDSDLKLSRRCVVYMYDQKQVLNY